MNKEPLDQASQWLVALNNNSPPGFPPPSNDFLHPTYLWMTHNYLCEYSILDLPGAALTPRATSFPTAAAAAALGPASTL